MRLSLAAPLRSPDDETHLPAQQAAPQAHARVPRAHGHGPGSQGLEPASRQGSQEADSVSAHSSSTHRTAAVRLKFPARLRLRRKSDYEAVHARGRRFGDTLFAMIARPNEQGPRLGLAVATKTAGNSVQRNRIRRLVRESFRLRQHELPPMDFVVSARTRARGAGNIEVRASLDALWNKVKEQCASPSRS